MSVLSSNFIINTEAFILEVKSRPAIWDSRDLSYGSPVEKHHAWEEICEIFVTNFESKSDSERSAYGNELRKKWKNLRDSFTREANRLKRAEQGGYSVSRKKYMFYDLLSFLGPVCGSKLSSSSENQEDPLEKIEEVTIVQDDRNNALKRMRLTDEHKLYKELSDSIVNISRTQEEHNDPDRQFLLSLLPDFKEIPQSSKLVAKVEIMSVIHKYTRLQDFQSNSILESHINYEYNEPKILKSEESPASPATSQTSQTSNS